MNQYYEYEIVVNERVKLSNVIEHLKENESVKKYLELCEEQKKLVSKEKELKNIKFFSLKEFQNMCYDYDIAI